MLRTIEVLDTVATENLLVELENLLVELENQRRLKTGQPRVLLPKPPRAGAAQLWSPRRINALFRGLPCAGRYLEIGVESGFTLENIEVDARWGVDPAPRFDLSRLPRRVEFFEGTSDEFFQQLGHDTDFDVAFIDGLHTFEQTYKDLLNTLAHLRDGAVLLDDTVPSDEISAIPDQRASLARRRELGLDGRPWHGDVWKLVVCVARHLPELDFRTILGTDNPQTLLWRKHRGVDVTRPDVDAVREVAELSYGDVFADGVPDLFRPCSEHEALSACLTVVSPRR